MTGPDAPRLTGDLAQQVVASIDLTHSTNLGVRMVGDGAELTPVEVARKFGVSATTVRRWEQRGWLGPARRLPGSRYRRYASVDVDEFRRQWDAGVFDQPAPTVTDGVEPAGP